MTADGARQALPTVGGFAVKQAIVALRKLGVATASLLHRAGLSEHDFARFLSFLAKSPETRRITPIAATEAVSGSVRRMATGPSNA
jgi:hypothetical protein